MKRNFILFFLVLALIGAVSSCQKTVGKKEAPAPVAVNFCDTITYTKHVLPIINTSCAKSGCHDQNTQSGGVVFPAMVKAQADNGRIAARVIRGEGGYMPSDNGKLPDAQFNIIQCWLNKGAPMN